MNRSVLPRAARMPPAPSAALSSARTTVVPTATIRPPRDRAVSFREDGLIAGRVLDSSFGIAVSVDVGRKRNAPRCGERRAEIAPLCGAEGDPVHLARAGAEVANLERRPHIDLRAGRRRS